MATQKMLMLKLQAAIRHRSLSTLRRYRTLRIQRQISLPYHQIKLSKSQTTQSLKLETWEVMLKRLHLASNAIKSFYTSVLVMDVHTRPPPSPTGNATKKAKSIGLKNDSCA